MPARVAQCFVFWRIFELFAHRDDVFGAHGEFFGAFVSTRKFIKKLDFGFLSSICS